jgi:hypothetical protein
MQITVDFLYAGFILECVCEYQPAEQQTQYEPAVKAEFVVEEINLDGKCAIELIGFEDWPIAKQYAFDAAVEAKAMERDE